MRSDFTAAIRSLTGAKTFTVVAITVLALGIGATTAIYSVVDGVLFRQLSYAEPDRLVVVKEHRPPEPWHEGPPVAPQNFVDWDARQDVFEALAATASRHVTAVDPGSPPEDVVLQRVTADFFQVLRFAPALGRTFDDANETAGRDAVIVLSHGMWQRRYGGASDVIGRVITLDRVPFEIVGVLAAEATFTGSGDRTADAFVPLVIPTNERLRMPNVSVRYMSTVARLRMGVTREQAQARMDQIAASLRAEHPSWNENHHVLVLPLLADVVDSEWRAWLWMLFGAAAVVLAIACVNVAMLQVARAAARQHEMSVRASLGGGRWRLVRLLLVENLVLAILGTLAAVGVANASVALLKTTIPYAMPRQEEILVDARVLLVMAVAAAVVGVGVGLAPALQLSSPRVAMGLRNATRTMAGRSSSRLRRALVAAEVALALVLLIGAALFVRSFRAATSIELGFDPAHVLTAALAAPPRPDETVGASIQVPPASESRTRDPLIAALVDDVSALAGVEAAAFARPGGHIGAASFGAGIEVPGRTLPVDTTVTVRRVTAAYHRLLRIPLVEGRLLTHADELGATAVALVNQAAVRTYFGGDSPLGETVVVGGSPHVVIGVVGDARQLVSMPVSAEVYVGLGAGGRGLRGAGGQLLVRTKGDPSAFASAVTRVAARLLPDFPLRAVGTMEATLDRMSSWRRFDMWLVSLFGVLGLVIAAVGLYGTLAYGVERRTREIGVRMALGAAPAAVVRLVVGETGRLLAVGLALGSLGAWWLATFVERHLFETDPRDPLSFAAAALVLSLTALLASVVPARRALDVSPAEALRAE